MATKPWFQTELERVTHEKWRVTRNEHGMAVKCTHGMLISVPYPAGLDRPFLNDAAERQFVGHVLPAHRPWEEVKVLWPMLNG